MKIRTQNLSAIVPIFLVMCLISGALTYITQRQEIMWGMREEISAMAIAMAQFLDREVVREIQEETGNEELRERLETTLKRVEHWNKKQRFFLLTPDYREVFFSFGGKDENRNISQQVFSKLKDEKTDIILTGVERNNQNRAIITAYVPIYDQARTLLSVLGVEIDAQYFLDRTKEIRNRIYIVTSFIVLLGIIIASFISRIITRKINQLTQASLTVASGKYNQRVNIGTIQEVSDLTNTFNTMSSILESHNFFAPVEDDFNKVSVSARLISSNPGGDFFGVFNVDNGTYAVLGRLSKNGELDTVTCSSAAYTFIQQELNQHDPQQAFENTKRLFDLETFQCLFWDGAGGKIQTYRSHDSGLLESAVPYVK
jgi:HAMP domain-containing protein